MQVMLRLISEQCQIKINIGIRITHGSESCITVYIILAQTVDTKIMIRPKLVTILLCIEATAVLATFGHDL